MSGKPTLIFAYPVHDGNRASGVITLALDLNWLHEFVDRSGLPPGTTLTLIDNQGVVLARHPDNTLVGTEAPEISYVLDSIQNIKQGRAEVEVHDSRDQSHYEIITPLRLSEQEGYLHLIISVPKDALLP